MIDVRAWRQREVRACLWLGHVEKHCAGTLKFLCCETRDSGGIITMKMYPEIVLNCATSMFLCLMPGGRRSSMHFTARVRVYTYEDPISLESQVLRMGNSRLKNIFTHRPEILLESVVAACFTQELTFFRHSPRTGVTGRNSGLGLGVRPVPDF